MSKKNAMLALALAVLIPIFAAASAEAADVPDFRQIAGRQVEFTSIVKKKNIARDRIYTYRWSVDLEENFVEQYVNLIQRGGLFKLTAHKGGNLKSGSTFSREIWVFNYIGSKKHVPTFKTVENDPYDAHVYIAKDSNYKTGVTDLTIWIAPRLTYGGDE